MGGGWGSVHRRLDDPTPENQSTSHCPMPQLELSELQAVGVERDVVGAVDQRGVHEGHAQEEGYQNKRGDLVLAKEALDANVAADEAQEDDEGAEYRDPPRHEQDRLVVAEGPGRRRR